MSDPALLEAPPSTSASPLADLLLTRLLLAKKSIKCKKLLDDVAPLFSRAPTKEKVEAVLEELRAAGLVHSRQPPTPPKKSGQRSTRSSHNEDESITDAGRARALAYLGIEELPPRATWKSVKDKYLVAKALGLSAASKEDAKVLGNADKLAAFMLKRKLQLPPETPTTPKGVVQAFVCQQLGYPDYISIDELVSHLLGKATRGDGPLKLKAAEKVLPRALLEIRTVRNWIEGLRAAALANLAREEDAAAPPVMEEPAVVVEPFDLPTFASRVLAAARACPTGRFGDNKVFISHVWRQVRGEPLFAPLGLAGFKEKLLEANRENRLTLSRADLVQVMNQDDVSESEVSYLNTVYHFILLEKE